MGKEKMAVVDVFCWSVSKLGSPLTVASSPIGMSPSVFFHCIVSSQLQTVACKSCWMLFQCSDCTCLAFLMLPFLEKSLSFCTICGQTLLSESHFVRCSCDAVARCLTCKLMTSSKTSEKSITMPVFASCCRFLAVQLLGVQSSSSSLLSALGLPLALAARACFAMISNTLGLDLHSCSQHSTRPSHSGSVLSFVTFPSSTEQLTKLLQFLHSFDLHKAFVFSRG